MEVVLKASVSTFNDLLHGEACHSAVKFFYRSTHSSWGFTQPIAKYLVFFLWIWLFVIQPPVRAYIREIRRAFYVYASLIYCN